ncbi:MarR family transcriptional regulator [Streptomyces sp. ME18-1-4]|uniref:MarR family transcriptional regulator n=1 Tax=Streptomyces sp. ME18-1-4 TaxID=3028685 RepID=UPI0029B074DB|nr:MarR family transcriptional regulator [Streptomyces sp. ME18-1-4]MDX3243016.1 MarR family transcriptional regulator [Streptomyces sp. ME18-1-4]
MACENSNAALPAPAHPTANPGYGKRTVRAEPGTASRAVADFSHLPAREACIAAFIDRLPDGSAMDIKSLAKALPLHGQQAVSSALVALSRAGHLHRARGLAATSDNGTRWVFRTYWSRTARDDAWWAAFLDGREVPGIAQGGDVPALGSPPAVPPVNPTPDHTTPSADAPAAPAPAEPAPTEPHTTTAYRVLARLGTFDPRLVLSAADCDALTDLLVPWLERGASTVSVIQALTAGLPDAVHAPRGFVARRLRDKLPPEPMLPVLVAAAADDPSSDRPGRLMPECTDCGVPGRPAAFVGGLCRGCRTATAFQSTPTAAPRTGSHPCRQSSLVLAREALAARDRRQSAKSSSIMARQP